MEDRSRDELILSNINLVHHCLQKCLSILPGSSEYQDLFSVGQLALVYAARNFDETKGFAFSTYAIPTIIGQVRRYLRDNRYSVKVNRSLQDLAYKAKKLQNELEEDVSIETLAEILGEDPAKVEYSLNAIKHTISLDQPIDDDGKSSVGDFVPDSKSDYTESYSEFEELLKAILNFLNPQQRLVTLYELSGIPQTTIAIMLKQSQAQVSRLYLKARNSLKDYLLRNPRTTHKEVFSVSVSDEYYKITFKSEDIENFNQILSNFFAKQTDTSFLSDYTVSNTENRTTISIPAYPEALLLIAMIIREIDEFDIVHKSTEESIDTKKRNMLLLESQFSQNNSPQESLDKESISAVNKQPNVVTEQQKPKVVKAPEMKKAEKTRKDSDTKNTSQSQLVKEYILSLNEFSMQQVMEAFPSIPKVIINNVIRLNLKRGLITKTNKDTYKTK